MAAAVVPAGPAGPVDAPVVLAAVAVPVVPAAAAVSVPVVAAVPLVPVPRPVAASAVVADRVAVAEAVTIAKELSTDDSPDYVNGLLGRIQQLKPTLLD